MSVPNALSTSPALAGEGSGGGKFSSLCLLIGILGIAVAAYGLMTGVQEGSSRPVISWLLGFSFWFTILMGMLFMILLSHVFDAGWFVIVRRQLEHFLAGFPLLALLFLPLLVVPFLDVPNPGVLWKWMNPEYVIPPNIQVGEDAFFLHKEPYLSIPFFVVRVLAYFAVFVVVAHLLRRASFQLDRDGDLRQVRRARVVSAIGLFACGLAGTFAAFDWYMTLEYHWFSTIFGVWFFSASMRAAIAVTILVCLFLAAKGHLRGIYNQAHSYDLGNMALAFTVFWAYISFSQYFLIYQANIPEVTFWYNIREFNPGGGLNSWWWVSMGLIFAHFLFPFLYLLWYRNKITPARIAFISIWILFFHVIDLYWNIVPGKVFTLENVLYYNVRQFSITPYDLAMIIGVGGLCLWAALRSMAKTEPIPIRDPRIKESIHHHE